MDAERMLVSKLAAAGGIEEVVARGIDERHFAQAQEQSIWQYMTEHLRNHKSTPSLVALRSRFVDYNFELVTDSLSFVLEQFENGVKLREGTQAVRALAQALDDPEQVPTINEVFTDQARALSMLFPGSSLALMSDMDKRVEEYKRQAKQGRRSGILMGIPMLDELTAGIQPHEYVTILGWTGIGKSTLTQWILMNTFLEGANPMLVSLEMDKSSLFRKWDTMFVQKRAREEGLGGFKYRDLKNFNLTDKELSFYESCAKELRAVKNDVLVLDDVRRFNVDRVHAEAARHKPDLIAIDYITLMEEARKGSSSAMWERITQLTQNLKHAARTLNIPIIGVAQTNREGERAGASMSNTAYSNSINQDSDIMIGFGQRTEEMITNKQTSVRLVKNRDGATAEVDLWWDMDLMDFCPWDSKADRVALGAFRR